MRFASTLALAALALMVARAHAEGAMPAGNAAAGKAKAAVCGA